MISRACGNPGPLCIFDESALSIRLHEEKNNDVEP